MAITDDGNRSWDGEFDIVVVGYGYAGGAAAIEASEAGCSVLLTEKMSDPGGISICSGGNVRAAEDADAAFAYLKRTCAGTTPDDVLKALAVGMTEVVGYFERLAEASGAEVQHRASPGNYPFPGAETFGYATDVRSLTQGRATYSMEFDHYAQAPDHVAREVAGERERPGAKAAG